MNTYFLLLAESALSVAISLWVLAVLARPLFDVLRRSCPDKQAALFWLKYTHVMLVISPLWLVLTVDLQAPMTLSRLAIMAAMAGILFGLYLLAKRVNRFAAAPQKAWSIV